MDFTFNDEQVMFRNTVRKFAEKELALAASRWDENEEFPAENLAKAAELGLMGLTIPEAYGGGGAGMIYFVIMLEEIAKHDPATAVCLLIHCGVATRAIWALGPDHLKQKYLPDLASGKKLAAFAQTEPNAGSDATAMKTTAVDKGDHYVLNGTKCFITNGGRASVITVLAKTDPTQKSKGISAFVVEKDFPGFYVTKEEKKMGIRGSSTAELVFENCVVPKENLLAEAPTAFGRIMAVFNGERVGNSAVCLGIAEGAFERALKYVQEREAFGQPVAKFQGIRWMLADMATEIEAAKLLIYQAAFRIDAGLPFVKEASMAKLFANEMVKRITDNAIQLHGGYGYMQEYEVERLARDARFGSLGGGTTQIQRNTIASQLLGNSKEK